mgnify:CR=1 FL=1
MQITQLLDTHQHADHVSGIVKLVKTLTTETNMEKIRLYFSSLEDYDTSKTELKNIMYVKGEDKIDIDDKVTLRAIHTPGHTAGGLCFLIGEKLLFTGDTLFVGNCGRTDLPGSDPEEMYNSLFEKIMNLENNMIVYPGHNYGYKPTSTIEEEKKNNYVLIPRSKNEFIKFITHGE